MSVAPSIEPAAGTEVAPQRFAARHSPWWFLGPLSVIFVVCLLAPVFPVPSPNAQDLSHTSLPPVGFGGTWSHPLGTNDLGQDILSQLLWGGRLSFFIAIAGVVGAGLIGTTLGILGGFRRGASDLVITRLIDAQLALPFLLIAITMIAARGQSLTVLVAVLSITGWATYARVMRADTLTLRERQFTVALHAAGVPPRRIMTRHILPNSMSTLLVLCTLTFGQMIIAEGALSFLGLGVTPPNISWGLMLAEGREFLQTTWWVEVCPGLAILVVVLLANLAGDSLRAVYDPRKRGYGR
jgi:peptide/nickel transport system permease protein